MVDRLMLFRPLTMELLHSSVPWQTGEDTRKRSNHHTATFKVAPEWHDRVAADGAPYFMKRGTLAVVVRPNNTVRHVGLVYDPVPGHSELTVRCGGYSMLAAQSGPWEGHQGYYVHQDPVRLFRTIWEQVQAYPDADLGIRVTGDTSSGSSVGYAGSARYQQARRDYSRYKPELEKWEGRMVTRERVLAQREEEMFRAAGLKRVGSVSETENETNPPDDPGYKSDSTLWINLAQGSRGRAYRWVDGRWHSQSQADDAVARWQSARGTVERGRAELDRIRYIVEPLQDLLDELELEAREEYSLYYWQNHNMGQVIEELTELGPFEYREQARLIETSEGKPGLDLQIEVGAPRVGVRRPELRFELGVNVQDHPPIEYGDLYTGVALFGAGQGSEVLSEQRSWNPRHAVRNILTETDKDAHTRQLTRNAANALLDEVKAMAGMSFSSLTVHHTNTVFEGSFDVGDEIFLAGKLSDGTKADRWVRIVEARHEWGSKTTSLEVEPV